MGKCILFSAYKICLLFYIAGSKWRGVSSEMFSWVKALYSTSCSWELFIWRQTMASNIIVSIRCFLHQALFLFLVIISRPATFRCLCVFYTLMHGRILHNFSNTGSHILSNASTLSSSYSAFLSLPHQITPPCIDHELFVVNHLNRDSSPCRAHTLSVNMKVRLSFYFFQKDIEKKWKWKHALNCM